MGVGRRSRYAEAFTEMFVNRTDIYAVQYATAAGNGYRAIRRLLSRELVSAHLAGQFTLGLYALSAESTAKWLVIDLDTTDVAELEKVLEISRRLGLPAPIIEFSGRRGYHLWWFFQNPVPGWQARRLGVAISREHEVFPKQDRVSKDTSNPGSLVKGPLGIHQVSGKWSVFLNKDFEQISDPWTMLESIEKADINKFLPLVGQDHSKRISSPRPYGLPNRMRPCIENALRDGSREGQRNEVGHIIACEMRRLGRSKEEAAACLICWNLRNQPRLSQDELDLILRGAYGEKAYSYGCAPEGHLRRVLVCLGVQNCPYWCDGSAKKKE